MRPNKMTEAIFDQTASAGPLINVNIGHEIYAAVTDPNTACFALVANSKAEDNLWDGCDAGTKTTFIMP